MGWSYWDDYNERNNDDAELEKPLEKKYGDPFKVENKQPVEYSGRKYYIQFIVFGKTYYI